MTATQTQIVQQKPSKYRKTKNKVQPPELKMEIGVKGFAKSPIPGYGSKAFLADCVVPVEDLIKELENYMAVNPRIPARKATGEASGPIIRDIKKTITEEPEQMLIRNQGIYLLVDSARFMNKTNKVILTLNDNTIHGIVNGGHTYVAIREVLESAHELEHEVERDERLNYLNKAYVRLHIYEGIPQDRVTEIAESLNRSKQVDDASLMNLAHKFDLIKSAMNTVLGEDEIYYNQGEPGSIYVTEIVACLEMFNQERYDQHHHPNRLYRKSNVALRMYEDDIEKAPFKRLIKKLPDILLLRDSIKKLTPGTCREIGFQVGRMKVTKKAKKRAKVKDVSHPLPFLGDEMEYKIPNGWVFPMMAAFRANLDKNGDWIMNPLDLLQDVIVDLIRVCVSEHKDNNLKPESLGNKESAYRQCFQTIMMKLLKKGFIR